MNWKLIFLLSLFGLVMAFATVYWIPSSIEPAFWLVIFIICAYFIAKNAPGKYFLHGFLVSLVNSVWITGAHILFFNTYILTQPDKLEMGYKMFLANHLKIQMLIMGPVFGVGFGLILGLFSWIASMIFKKPAATAS